MRATSIFSALVPCGVAAIWACSSSSSNGIVSPTASDSGEAPIDNAAPAAGFTEGSPMGAPPGASALGSLAIDAASGALYVASGTSILRGSASAGGSLSPFADLASAGVTRVSTMRVTANGDLVVASSDSVVRVTASGSVGAPVRVAVPFSTGGFSAASLALTPDGRTLFAVEGGSGSAGDDGGSVVHVARFDLPLTDGASAPPLGDRGDGAPPGQAPAEVFELQSPFEVVPSTTSAINAGAPFVSLDGALLYVPHIVLRNVFAVTVAAPHTVSEVDTDSLDRSVTADSLDSNELLVESAVFDQTVPVFRMKDARKATFVTEIPFGLSPGAVASYQSRVFVVLSAGLGGFPAFGDGGFPSFGDGGLAGGGPPGAGGDGGGASASAEAIRVFDLKVTQ